MRPRTSSPAPRGLPAARMVRAAFTLAFALSGAGLVVQPAGAQLSAADSLALLAELRESQAGFERFRESRIPTSTSAASGGCDARMGRICVWFGGAGELNFPREPVETELARLELIGELADGAARIRDPWIVGQWVHYLAEDGSLREAERVARECDLDASWWCSALLGYALHLQDRFVEAEEAFRTALAGIPPEEEGRWLLPRYLVPMGIERELRELEPAERERRVALFWRLSDPLFLIEGNDRWTEHYVRLVEARNQERAENPYGIEWAEDMEESLVRYGRNLGYSRIRPPPPGLGGGFSLEDTRRIVGHHHPASRGYIFPEAFLESPADIPPESWVTAPRAARSWYAPPYAPDFRRLETQVARFRRDDQMLVVGAYRPAPPDRDPLAALAPPDAADARSDPFASRRTQPTAPPPGWDDEVIDIRGPVQTGFFLVPEDGGDMISVIENEPAGVLTLQAPPGRYVSSLELFEPQGRRAWRARQGVVQVPLVRGNVAVSDLMILNRDAPFPESMEEAIPLARPGIRVGRAERFTVVWEVYGLQVEEEVRVTLGFTEGRPGFLARVGEFLGIVEPDRPVEVTFTDAAPDEVQTLFRAVTLGLPELDPGEYTLHLRLELSGREPALASRPITVVP